MYSAARAILSKRAPAPVFCLRQCSSQKSGPLLELLSSSLPLPSQCYSFSRSQTCPVCPSPHRPAIPFIRTPCLHGSTGLQPCCSPVHSSQCSWSDFYEKASLILSLHWLKLSLALCLVYKPYVFWPLPNFPSSCSLCRSPMPWVPASLSYSSSSDGSRYCPFPLYP